MTPYWWHEQLSGREPSRVLHAVSHATAFALEMPGSEVSVSREGIKISVAVLRDEDPAAVEARADGLRAMLDNLVPEGAACGIQ